MADEPIRNLSCFLNHVIAKLNRCAGEWKFHDDHAPFWERGKGHATVCFIHTRRIYNVSFSDGGWYAFEWGASLDARLTGVLRGQVRDDSGNMVDRPVKAVAS